MQILLVVFVSKETDHLGLVPAITMLVCTQILYYCFEYGVIIGDLGMRIIATCICDIHG